MNKIYSNWMKSLIEQNMHKWKSILTKIVILCSVCELFSERFKWICVSCRTVSIKWTSGWQAFAVLARYWCRRSRLDAIKHRLGGKGLVCDFDKNWPGEIQRNRIESIDRSTCKWMPYVLVIFTDMSPETLWLLLAFRTQITLNFCLEQTNRYCVMQRNCRREANTWCWKVRYTLGVKIWW